jgi:hypothetical protein
MAGHVRLELGNVVPNYPFEGSRRFPGSGRVLATRDYSRLSCGGGETQLGPSTQDSQQRCLRGRWSIAEVEGLAAILCRSKDDRAATKPATPLLTLRWTFPANRASVVITDRSLNGFAEFRVAT